MKNGACAHYLMVSKFQWKPFWLAIERDAQNDWTATQNRVNYDVFAQTPFNLVIMTPIEMQGATPEHTNQLLTQHMLQRGLFTTFGFLAFV